MLSSPVSGQAGCAGEELEADVTLDQRLELPGVAGKHIGVVGAVVVPETRQLLQQHKNRAVHSQLNTCSVHAQVVFL